MNNVFEGNASAARQLGTMADEANYLLLRGPGDSSAA